MRITKKYMIEVLDRAEDHLGRLFDDLLHIKNFKRPDFDVRKIMYFQYHLGKLLHHVAKVRNRVTEEERTTIGKKQSLSSKWFKARMKRLSEYKIMLTRCIEMGKSLGDAFAWHFYKNNETQLFKHLEHEEIKIPPTGDGGLGELVFIREYPVFGKYFCILHSNTSLLRYGDVSLIDFETMKLFAIGEIKTEALIDNKLSLSVTLLGDDATVILKEDFANVPKLQATDASKIMFDKDRYQRQLKKIGEYLNEANKPKKGPDQFIFENYYIKEFEEVVKGCEGKRYYAQKVADGLLYASQELKPQKLSARLFSRAKKPKPGKYKAMLEDIVASLFSPEILNLDIQYGYIHYTKELSYTAALGTAPLFWYPIRASILKKIYLQEVFVISLYNPGYLFHELRKLGLDIRKEEGSGKIYFGMKVGENNMGIERMGFFLNLIKNHLHSQRCVVDAVTKMIEAMKAHAGSKVPVAMEIATVQIFDEYNTDLEENTDNRVT